MLCRVMGCCSAALGKWCQRLYCEVEVTAASLALLSLSLQVTSGTQVPPP